MIALFQTQLMHPKCVTDTSNVRSKFSHQTLILRRRKTFSDFKPHLNHPQIFFALVYADQSWWKLSSIIIDPRGKKNNLTVRGTARPAINQSTPERTLHSQRVAAFPRLLQPLRLLQIRANPREHMDLRLSPHAPFSSYY